MSIDLTIVTSTQTRMSALKKNITNLVTGCFRNILTAIHLNNMATMQPLHDLFYAMFFVTIIFALQSTIMAALQFFLARSSAFCQLLILITLYINFMIARHHSFFAFNSARLMLINAFFALVSAFVTTFSLPFAKFIAFLHLFLVTCGIYRSL